MSGHTKKPLTSNVVEVTVHDGLPVTFVINSRHSPKLLRVLQSMQTADNESDLISADTVFKSLDARYGKIGATIRGFRVRDGLTQKELAARLHIHQVHISQIENKKRPVGKKLAHKLAAVFHTSYRLFL
jgi:DNA-binding XRE family transcriptional regulator